MRRLMGVLLDAVFPWAIYGASHAGAARVVGPLLITATFGRARTIGLFSEGGEP